ncbi:MAG TPA: hypothetical protein VIU33_03225 [Nitrospiria bacterium]
MRFLRVNLLFFLAGALGALTVPAASSAANPSLLNLTNPQTSHSVVDAKGWIHSITIEPTAQGSRILYQAIDPLRLSGGLEPAVLLHESDARIRRPQIAVDSADAIHFLWQEKFKRTSGNRKTEGTWVHYAKAHGFEAVSAGAVWHTVLNSRPKALHPNLSVGPKGSGLAVWEEQNGKLLVAEIFPETGSISRGVVEHGNPDSFARAFPAAAVDEDGRMHLVWTQSSGVEEDEIVYSVVDRKRVHAPVLLKRTIHSVPAALGQRKMLAFNSNGGLDLLWETKRAEGPFAAASSHKNRLSLDIALWLAEGTRMWAASGPGLVRDIAESHLDGNPETWAGPMGVAVTTKRLTFNPPALSTVAVEFSPQAKRELGRLQNSWVEQRLKRVLLEYASWSGAPPREKVMVFPSPQASLSGNPAASPNNPIKASFPSTSKTLQQNHHQRNHQHVSLLMTLEVQYV